jgi:hypothetical protein
MLLKIDSSLGPSSKSRRRVSVSLLIASTNPSEERGHYGNSYHRERVGWTCCYSGSFRESFRLEKKKRSSKESLTTSNSFHQSSMGIVHMKGSSLLEWGKTATRYAHHVRRRPYVYSYSSFTLVRILHKIYHLTAGVHQHTK